LETLPLSHIKVLLSETPVAELPPVLENFEKDVRSGVKALVAAYNKKHQAFTAELQRLKTMRYYEDAAYALGFRNVAGVDEVGRGPLAGPVVAAAVILPMHSVILGVNDSKQLSEKKRKALFAEISENAAAIGIGVVSPKTIDEINILKATHLAMRKAVENLSVPPQTVLVDAETIPGIPYRQEAIIKGDTKSVSIAAASIIAKVTRDRMMRVYADIYPAYAFAENKGYGSAQHMAAIEQHGICAIHRKSFTTESKRKTSGERSGFVGRE
jgi:ribonuclease HII